MAKKANSITIVLIFMSMILMALVDNTKGIFIPLFKRDFQIIDTNIGAMLMVCSIGYMIFTYIGGYLCEKIGQKRVFISGFIIVIISLVLLYYTNNFYMLLVSMFFQNMGLSLIAISCNTLIPVLFLSYQAILMNLTHFCYGLGSTVAQRTFGIFIYNGVKWKSIYLGIAILYALVLILFIFIKIPTVHNKKDNIPISFNDVICSKKMIIFYILALGFYVSAEMGTGNWFVNFMENKYQFNKNTSSFYIALFYGTFTLGRLLGGFIVEKIGYFKMLKTSSIIACLLFLVGLILGQQGIIIISLSGLFFAITFPTLVLTISKVFKQNSSYITGIIITFASFISMLMNLFIGFLNDFIGVYKTFYLIPISMFTCFIFMYFISINIQIDNK